MPLLRLFNHRSLLLIVSLLCFLPDPAGSGSETSRETRADMHQLVNNVSLVFHLSLDESKFQDPENRDQILDALYDLAAVAAQLGDHGEKPEPSYDYFNRSLVRDANEAVLRFRQNQYEGSRFLLGRLMDNCFACHSRLPADQTLVVGGLLTGDVDTSELTRQDIARLQVVTRQFDAAIQTYEEILLSESLPASEIAVSGVFEDYFRIALRVEGDYGRVMENLKKFNARPDVPLYLSGRVNRWYKDTKEIKKAQSKKRGDLLDNGRKLVRDAQYRAAFPHDPQSTVRYTVASGYLTRYLQQDLDREPERLVEAYYLLGVAESNISVSYWSSETELLLEQAIRTAPQSVYGRMAFNFLEEYTVGGYTGSSGVHIPPDVKDRLDGLRALVEADSAQ